MPPVMGHSDGMHALKGKHATPPERGVGTWLGLFLFNNGS